MILALSKTELLALLESPEARAMIADIAAEHVLQGALGRGRYEHFDIDRLQSLAAAISSVEFVAGAMPRVARFPNGDEFLKAMLAIPAPAGLVLEFGVFSGHSIGLIASARPDQTVYGFDSFEGLPEYWRPGFDTGTFKTEGLPAVPANVTLVPGWFDRSLPAFLDAHPGQPVSFLHIDCDLYSSTQTVLAQLKDRIIAGTVIVFDEYLNYPGWQHHEHKAFSEFIASTGRAYEWIGLVPSYEQAAIRILN